MSLFRHFCRKLSINPLRLDLGPQIAQIQAQYIRLLSYSPMHYGDTPDPGPLFVKHEVQALLKTLTRIDLGKVFAKRKLGEKRLQQPVYKFMTDEELKAAVDEAKKKVDRMLQIPPVVAVRKPKDRIVSDDPALQGMDTATYIFTDITYGISDSDRIILVREPNGSLREADWGTRDRMNQMYFPVQRRQVNVPRMFQDDYFEDLLKRGEYVFILDRACIQFEPNDALYQKVVSVTYQHINDNNQFTVLRSTRHFGSFAFFLAWNKMIDNLLLDVIETEHFDEATALVELYGQVHGINFEKNKLEQYIERYSGKKAALELALQASRNSAKRKRELEEGIKRAHGVS